MKIEKQVCSLELSKELKENGYPQEGLFWWNRWESPYPHHTVENKKLFKDCIIAPTVSELGEALPKEVMSQRKIGMREQDKDKWCCFEKIPNRGAIGLSFMADTEADARAKMWLYLKKNGLLETP